MMYGSDWRYANTLGIEDKLNGNNQLYGGALPQFYADVAYNKLALRVGHWAPCAGIEVVPAPGNFFYSHSYGLCAGQPLLVSGWQLSYQLTDQWTIKGGMNRGWYMFEDNNDAWDLMYGMEWNSCDKRTNLRFSLDNGPQDVNGQHNRFVYTFDLTHKINDRWTYSLEHDLGFEDNGNPRTAQDATWYGLINYLTYQINTKWAAGMRAEWFRDEDGARVAGLGNLPNMRGWGGGPGFCGDFTELTMGLNWRPNANILVRPEARWDWYDGTTDVHGGLPYTNGSRNNMFSFATDLVLTF